MHRRLFAAFAVVSTFALVFLLCDFSAVSAWAYTQSAFGTSIANGVPMGHEWITRMAAVELLGAPTPLTPPDMPDPNDPRKTWTQGLAKNLNLAGAQSEVARIKSEVWNDTRYASRYKAVYDAIIGERWVDIAGYNIAVTKLSTIDCWDRVAQEPASIQYDHFMRRFDERNGQGGVTAATNSQQRFIKYFTDAANASSTTILVYDGGVAGSTEVEVNRNYFLFGRAVHMFEDSFSSEHTVRIKDDNYTRIRQVKSYLCAAGSEQHSHSNSAVLNYSSGDVIWRQGTGIDNTWNSYKASNMKYSPAVPSPLGTALVATEATKDLWAAFIRTMAVPAGQPRATAAQYEAQTLVNNWLSFDRNEMLTWYNNPANRDDTYVLGDGDTGKGKTVAACMATLDVGTNDPAVYNQQLERDKRVCLYNALPREGYSDLYDPQLHMWFDWEWRNNARLETPPVDWQIPNPPADSGRSMRIQNVYNKQYISAPDGVSNNQWLYCRSGATPVNFTYVGSSGLKDGMIRVNSAPRLFISYNGTTGAVKLLDQPSQSHFSIANVPGSPSNTWAIKSTYWNQYMWLSGESPYITRTGNPANTNARWVIDWQR